MPLVYSSGIFFRLFLRLGVDVPRARGKRGHDNANDTNSPERGLLIMDELKKAMRDLTETWGRRVGSCDEVLAMPEITEEAKRRVTTKRGVINSMKIELQSEVNRVWIQTK